MTSTNRTRTPEEMAQSTAMIQLMNAYHDIQRLEAKLSEAKARYQEWLLKLNADRAKITR